MFMFRVGRLFVWLRDLWSIYRAIPGKEPE